jgi:hypothetical protein
MPRVGDEIGPCLSLEELARNGLAGRGGSRWASGRPEDCDGQWRLPGKGLDHAELGLFRLINSMGASVAQTQQGRLNQLQTPFGQ